MNGHSGNLSPSNSVSDSSDERQGAVKRRRMDHIGGEVNAMKREILKISRTFDGFINSQSTIFGKMSTLEGENMKLKIMNEELLQQLVAAEERQQMYEKLVATVLQFFKTRRSGTATLQASANQPLAIQAQSPLNAADRSADKRPLVSEMQGLMNQLMHAHASCERLEQ